MFQDQDIFPKVIILFILVTFFFDYVLILLGENYFSLMQGVWNTWDPKAYTFLIIVFLSQSCSM